jgi:RNA polymerase sigma-70 factor (ECF subfamily)
MRPSDGFDSQAHEEHLETLPDRRLLDGLQAGDVETFTTIVRLYAVKLEGYVRRSISDPDVAADIVQDVFTELWERRATVVVRTTLQAYLYGSARHHVLRKIRRTQLEDRCTVEFLATDTPPGIGNAPPRPDTLLERHELNVTLARALETLSPRVRQVALLRWRDRLSRAEIAAVLGVSVATVRNQLTTATAVLRKILTDIFSNE